MPLGGISSIFFRSNVSEHSLVSDQQQGSTKSPPCSFTSTSAFRKCKVN